MQPVKLGIDGLSAAVLIGSGGSASVYASIRESDGRQVAVKLLRASVATTAARKSFDREHETLTRLPPHGNLVEILGAGVTDRGEPYLLMPLMSGSLQDHVDQHGAMPWLDAAIAMAAVADAVEHAHLHDVLHRDLKPANILVDPSGAPRVADFGIAKLTDVTAGATTGLAVTPSFSAPERLEGLPATVGTDVYGLAATLSALLTGSRPFATTEGASLHSIIRSVINDPVPEIEVEGVPDSVRDLVASGMAKAPNERPGSAGAFASSLRSAISAHGPIDHRLTIVVEPKQWAPNSEPDIEPAKIVEPPPKAEMAARPKPVGRFALAAVVLAALGLTVLLLQVFGGSSITVPEPDAVVSAASQRTGATEPEATEPEATEPGATGVEAIAAGSEPGVATTVRGDDDQWRIEFDHPGWGRSSAVSTVGVDAATLEVFDQDGERRFFYSNDTGTIEAFEPAGIADQSWVRRTRSNESVVSSQDGLGRLFFRYRSGAYDGVVVLEPTPDGMDDLSTLPVGDGAIAPFYYAHPVDVDGDGVFEIENFAGECLPICQPASVRSEIFVASEFGYETELPTGECARGQSVIFGGYSTGEGEGEGPDAAAVSPVKVAICRDGEGELVYHGADLETDAEITLSACSTDTAWVAVNDGFTYRVQDNRSFAEQSTRAPSRGQGELTITSPDGLVTAWTIANDVPWVGDPAPITDCGDVDLRLSGDLTLSTGGLGPIRIGMSIAEAREASGVDLTDAFSTWFANTNGRCGHADVKTEGLESVFMGIGSFDGGTGSSFEEAEIKMIAVSSPDRIRTPSGATVGMTLEELRALFPGQLDEQASSTQGISGSLIFFVPKDPADITTLMFSTLGDDTEVVQMRAGYRDWLNPPFPGPPCPAS